jgi:hypothetical protein
MKKIDVPKNYEYKKIQIAVIALLFLRNLYHLYITIVIHQNTNTIKDQEWELSESSTNLETP